MNIAVCITDFLVVYDFEFYSVKPPSIPDISFMYLLVHFSLSLSLFLSPFSLYPPPSPSLPYSLVKTQLFTKLFSWLLAMYP